MASGKAEGMTASMKCIHVLLNSDSKTWVCLCPNLHLIGFVLKDRYSWVFCCISAWHKKRRRAVWKQAQTTSTHMQKTRGFALTVWNMIITRRQVHTQIDCQCPRCDLPMCCMLINTACCSHNSRALKINCALQLHMISASLLDFLNSDLFPFGRHF